MAKKATQETPAQEPPALVTVRVGAMPINEDGQHLTPGTVFETTPERAAALGELVTPAE